MLFIYMSFIYLHVVYLYTYLFIYMLFIYLHAVYLFTCCLFIYMNSCWSSHLEMNQTCWGLGARSVYGIQPCTSLHLIRSHIRRMHTCVFSCNQPPAPVAEATNPRFICLFIYMLFIYLNIVYLYTWTLVERLISRWALSASQWPLYSAILCVFALVVYYGTVSEWL